MKKYHSLHHRLHKSDRRKVTFTLSSILIASVFLVAITGILTGKFRPFASEDSSSSSSSTSPKLTIPPASLSYTDTSAVVGSAQSNSLELGVGSVPTGTVALQALPKKNSTESLSVTGKLSVRLSDGKALTDQPVEWTSSEYADSKKRKTSFDNATLLDAIDALPATYNLKVTLKPKGYLGVSAQNVQNIDNTINFPDAKVGDLNDDNRIDEADFAKWAPQFGKTVTSQNSSHDFNRDGKIDEADFSLGFSANFGKTGESL